MLIEQQIGERQARAGSAVARILKRPAGSAAAAEQPAATSGIETAAAGLIEAGAKFMQALFHAAGVGSGDASASPLGEMLSGLYTRDARTSRPVLSIPLPESVTPERIERAISGLVNSLG